MISQSKKDYNDRYYATNREQIIQVNRAYRLAHHAECVAYDRARYPKRREKDLARLKASYQSNREQKRAYNSDYWKNNSEKIKAVRKEYRQHNKELVRLRNLAYQRAHPDKTSAWSKKWRLKNPHKNSGYDAKRRALEKSREQEPSLLKKFYASVRNRKWVNCYWCGNRIRGKDAHIDHVIALAKGGNHAVENLAASCAPCNQSKSAKLPHEWPKHPQMFLTI